MFFFVWDTTCFYLGGVEKNPPHNSHYITLKVIENDVGFDGFFCCFKKRPGLEVALTRQGVGSASGFRLRKSAETARMSNWDGSCYRNHGERIKRVMSPVYKWSILGL